MADSSRSPVSHCKWGHEYTPENTDIGKDGKRRCRECARERGRRRPPPSKARQEYLTRYRREWMAKRRSDFLQGKSCVKCGSTDRLEVDHIDPDQKVSHRIWSWSDDRRLAELAKCQVLCNYHHKVKTFGWVDGKQPHGRYMYEKKGCRCGVCVEAVRARRRRQMRNQRARRKAGG